MVRIDCPVQHRNELEVALVAVVLHGTTATSLRFPCSDCGTETEVPATPAQLRLLAASGSPWLSSDGSVHAAAADRSDAPR